jgi:phosphoesterase RecJ-like protein
MNNGLQQAAHWLAQHKRIILATHQDADEDGLGAMFGLYHSLQSAGYKVIPFTNTPVHKSLSAIPGIHFKKSGLPSLQIDGIISLDIGEISRIDLPVGVLNNPNIAWLNIDHHPQDIPKKGTHWIDLNTSSTSEMIFLLLNAMDILITPHAATALIAGILYDTYHLHHQISEETYTVLGKLVQKGGDLDQIKEYMMHSQSKEAIQVWGYVLERLTADEDNQLAQAILEEKDMKKLNISEKDLNLGRLTNILGHLKEPQLIGFLREIESNTWKGSFRSTDNSNVSAKQAAEIFHGGGHEHASGFKFNGTKSDYLIQLKQLFKM